MIWLFALYFNNLRSNALAIEGGPLTTGQQQRFVNHTKSLKRFSFIVHSLLPDVNVLSKMPAEV